MITGKYRKNYMAASRRLQVGAKRGPDRTVDQANCSANQVNRLGKRHPSPIGRSTFRISVALLIGLIAAAALTASPALALTEHVFKTSFGGSGADALSEPTDVAVDNSSGPSAGDVYVTDPAKHRIEKFDPSGEFILMFGRDVNETTGGNVCTAASSDTCKVGIEGSSPGEFETPTFVTVDSSTANGNVYVGDTGNGTTGSVSKFTSEGALIASWGTGGQLTGFSPLKGIAVDPSGSLFVLSELVHWYEQNGNPHGEPFYPYRESRADGLAVDSEDNLYKVDGQPNVTKFSDTGEDLANTLDGGEASGLTVDPKSNELYVVETDGVVNHFAPNCGENCIPLDSFGSGHLTGAQGIGLEGAHGTAYVANTGSADVAKFEALIVPDATTGQAANLGPTSATVSGHVNPDGGGEITTCYFEYGTAFYRLGSVPCNTNLPLANEAEVTAEIGGLNHATTYHYRLVSGNAAGVNHGEELTFQTLPVAPVIGSEFVDDVHSESAQLNAKIDPDGGDSTYHFEIGIDTSYGISDPIPDVDLGSGNTFQAVQAQVGGLAPSTIYHYRVVATNECEPGNKCTVYGPDHTFTTFPLLSRLNENCPNSLARQQTGATLLLDCRAYELVSASNSGGYDVSSDLSGGEEAPFAGYSEAESPPRVALLG